MTSYPVSIEAQTIDLSTIMMENAQVASNVDVKHDKKAVYSNGKMLEMASNVTTNITKNNLTEFKKYLDNKNSDINK